MDMHLLPKTWSDGSRLSNTAVSTAVAVNVYYLRQWRRQCFCYGPFIGWFVCVEDNSTSWRLIFSTDVLWAKARSIRHQGPLPNTRLPGVKIFYACIAFQNIFSYQSHQIRPSLTLLGTIFRDLPHACNWMGWDSMQQKYIWHHLCTVMPFNLEWWNLAR